MPRKNSEPRKNQFAVTLGRWAFVIPVLTINMIVVIIPSVIGLGIAFTDWTGYNVPNFIGLDNFQRLFQDEIFFKALRNNLIWTLIFLTAPIAVGLLGAYILSTIKRGQMIFRVSYFIPYVIASVVNVQLWRQLLHPRVGIGAWLAERGINFLDFPVFGTRESALYGVAFVDAWHFWGFLVVIYLAAMSAVDKELYEVARLDGATPLQQFRHVTLPSIRPTLVFTILMIIIWSSTTFDYVYMLTSGGPANASELMSTYLYDNAFSRFDAGYAATIGIMMSLWVGLAVAGFVYLRRRGWEI
ncbi:MAG: sugar ABC transporter permease [Anaerolineae bacterium]|nr:sugar ABC transporter permease [Anaerolineae bacterium]MCA9892172.1 sugar ABC transporter permease [Anaerolineae bacterium]MCB9460265.1 sugar ABC transporter permease [Anaerolineaceae bacterium]